MMSSSASSAAGFKRSPTVSCPNCGESVIWNEDAAYRPFCSRRCRLIDLGDWLDERNTIPGEPAWLDPDAELDADGSRDPD